MINLSIILPTINEEENLKFLIPNIFEEIQSLGLESFELLVVDDGSIDNTKELIENLNKKYKNLKLIERKKHLHYQCQYLMVLIILNINMSCGLMLMDQCLPMLLSNW